MTDDPITAAAPADPTRDPAAGAAAPRERTGTLDAAA